MASETTNYQICFARPDDAAGCRAIYAPLVETSIVSFELEPPSLNDMAERIAVTMERYPWLIGRRDELVLGYAYGSAFRARPAYQWTVETTVYVHPDYRGQGMGRALYTALLAVLRLQGFRTALAAIAMPNPVSIALHERAGFTRLGVFRNCGLKLGCWVDVEWWEKEIQQLPDSSPPPCRLSEIQSHPVCRELIRSDHSH